jgi:hypothetical protein
MKRQNDVKCLSLANLTSLTLYLKVKQEGSLHTMRGPLRLRPYLQIKNKAENACQGQTIQLFGLFINEVGFFITIDTWRIYLMAECE